MTFEERMDRLAERHEALAQTVELHNSMFLRTETLQHETAIAIRENAVAIRDNGVAIRDNAIATQENALAMKHLQEMVADLMKAAVMLVKTADQHGLRITKLEGRA